MEEITASAKIDFANFLSLAQNKSLPWNYLYMIVDNMTLNEEQSKNIIKVLLKELQQLQEKQEVSENSLIKSSLEEAEIETVELDHSDLASETDVQSINDFSENEVSIVDLDAKASVDEFKINDEHQSEKVAPMIDNEYYMFVGENTENRSKSDEQENKSLESKECNLTDGLLITNEIPIEATKQYNIQKKHQCNICKKVFTTKQILIRHERIHTGKKPYQCKSCPKSFTHLESLKHHEKIHSGVKPFECESCPKSFITRAKLQSHERIHTGERPYQCKNCFKSFAQIGTLKNHEKFHTGEKPFKCQNCPKRFTLKFKFK